MGNGRRKQGFICNRGKSELEPWMRQSVWRSQTVTCRQSLSKSTPKGSRVGQVNHFVQRLNHPESERNSAAGGNSAPWWVRHWYWAVARWRKHSDLTWSIIGVGVEQRRSETQTRRTSCRQRRCQTTGALPPLMVIHRLQSVISRTPVSATFRLLSETELEFLYPSRQESHNNDDRLSHVRSVNQCKQMYCVAVTYGWIGATYRDYYTECM